MAQRGNGRSVLAFRNHSCLLRLALFLLSFALLGSGCAPAVESGSVNSAPYVKRSSSAIAITADGSTLLAVNPDSASLSIVDLTEPPAVTEIAVGADPRTVAVSDDGARAYTANRGGDSVSVVDLAAREVIAEIPTGARPYGVVTSPDGRFLFVTEQGDDSLAIVDTVALNRIASFPLPDRPSGLAITANGQRLYITHLLNRRISILNLPIHHFYLPLLHQKGSARSAAGSAGAAFPSIDLWPNSNLVQSIVIAPDGKHAYVPHTRSNSSNPALTLDTTLFPIVSVVDLETEQHLAGERLNLEILDPPAVGLPFDAAFTPDGAELWVLNAASNDVTVIDLANRQRVAHIEVGDNPRGIVISPDGGRAYVNNTLAGTISVVDTAAYSVTAVLPVTSIPLDPELLAGKRLFHSSDDPRMGQDQWMSCNSCHFDGEIDGRTWLLGFAGPRNTSSLLGMAGTLPLRWSGEWDEAADAEFAIRMDSFGTGLVEGDMRCSLDPPDCANQPPHAGLSADLDALAAYINALAVPLSPEGGSLSEAAVRGKAHFEDPAVGCAGCHPGLLYTDNLVHDVGTVTAGERIGPAFNTPSLLGLYDTPPYFHDGSAATLYEAVSRPSPGSEHDVRGELSAAEIEELVAFLNSLPYGE